MRSPAILSISLLSLMLIGISAACGAPARRPAADPALTPRNPGFEEGLKGWRPERPSGFANGKVESVQDGTAAGKWCVCLSSPAGQSITGLTCDPVPLKKGGTSFFLSFRYRTAGRPDVLEVRVRPLDEKGQGLVPWQDFHYNFLRLPPAEEWSDFSRACLIAADASAFDVTFWVRGEGTLFVDDVAVRVPRPEEVQVPSQAARLKGVDPQDVQVWYETAMRKVYRDAQAPAAEIPYVEITAARGECQAFQVVLRAKSDLKDARAMWQDLLGPGVLRREQGRTAWVDFVNVDRRRAPFARTGQTPDPFLPGDKRDLRKDETEPLWVSFQVPRNARPGLYKGGVRIKADWNEAFIPVHIRVLPFALPEQPALTTLARVWKSHPDTRDPFRDDFRDHRVTGEAWVGPLPFDVTPDGDVTIDFKPFDDAANAYFGQQGMRVFNFPGVFLGDASGFSSRERTWRGLEILSPQFNKAFSSFVRQVADHLREKGWLKYALVQLWDEPATEEARDTCRRVSALVRAAAPDARLYLTAAPCPALEGCADVWGVPLPDQFSPADIAAQREKGDAVWGYDNRLYSLDVETSSIAMRAYPWRLKRFGITGVEWWSVSDWVGDPYGKVNQYEPQNGGGFLLYPNRDNGKPAPVDSIRWEMYRQGVEDYDALTALEQAHAAAVEKLHVQDTRFDAAALIEWLTRPVALSIADSTNDPRVIEAARARVNAVTSLLAGDPPCLIRLEGEGPRLRAIGVTAPGAEISNGRLRCRADSAGHFDMPVDEQTLALMVSAGPNPRPLP